MDIIREEYSQNSILQSKISFDGFQNFCQELSNLQDVKEELIAENSLIERDINNINIEQKEIKQYYKESKRLSNSNLEDFENITKNNESLNIQNSKLEHLNNILSNQVDNLTVRLNENENEFIFLTILNDLYLKYLNNYNSLSQIKENESDNIIDFLESQVDIKNSISYKLINESDLFDKQWYSNKYLDNDEDPIEHYLLIGASLAYSTSPEFNTEFYLEKYPEVKQSKLNPLVEYILIGKNQNRTINSINEEITIDITDSQEYRMIKESKVFDDGWFKEEYNLDNSVNPLEYYMNIGYQKNCKPNKSFNLEQFNKNQADNTENPLIYYLLNEDITSQDNIENSDYTSDEIIENSQEYRIIEESGLFDVDYYHNTNPEINGNVLTHFIKEGYKQNRNPNGNFDLSNYCNEYQDIKENPLIDYIINNRKFITDNNKSDVELINYSDSFYEDYELLNSSVYFDNDYYLENNPNLNENEDPIEYYLIKGYLEEYSPSKYFNQAWYLEKNQDVKNQGINPLIHYLRIGKQTHRPTRWEKFNLNNLPRFNNDTTFKENYDRLYDSTLFDYEFYLEQVPELDSKKLDPIIHYLLYGVKENLDPSSYFSTSRYLKMYSDIGSNNLNPLNHYIEFGHMDRFIYYPVDDTLDLVDAVYSLHITKTIVNKLNDKISIVISVSDSYDDLKECIMSIFRNTFIDFELILVDATEDENIKNLLNSLNKLSNVRILKNNDSNSLISDINLGIQESGGDVVILHSDTIVTPNWLNNLVMTAYTDENIGTVTPISNSSNILIPELAHSNTHEFLNKVSNKVNILSKNKGIEVPFGNSFCMFIKRDLINKIGLFSEEYLEGFEVDYCSRAKNIGWTSICDDSVYVYHKEHDYISITDNDKKKIVQDLNLKYDDVLDKWYENFDLSPLLDSIYNIKENYNSNEISERILYVTKLKDNKPVLDDDFFKLSPNYDVYILTLNDGNEVDNASLILYKYVNNNFCLIKRWRETYEWNVDIFYRLYFNILKNLKINLIYSKHIEQNNSILFENYPLCLYMANIMGIKIVYDTFNNQKNLLKVVDSELYDYKLWDELIHEKYNNVDFNEHKCVVYTAISGNGSLLTPDYINPEFDYVCFTDNPYLISDFWEIRWMDDLDLDSVQKVNHYKAMPHKYLADYEYSIWFDSNIKIHGDITEYINNNSEDYKLLAVDYENSDCIYEYLEDNDKSDKLNGYPDHYGLVRSNVLFRNHNDEEIINLMNDWYYNLVESNCDDISSLNDVLYKNNFRYDSCSLFYSMNQYFSLVSNNEIKNTLKYDETTSINILDSFDDVVSIIIPIYNAYDETKACIESVFEYTSIPFELVLINDCSPDERIGQLLSGYESLDNVKVITNETNMGFVKNVNIGFNESGGDVVLLNSDTIVTPKWLEKLKVSAYQRENIATVTPVSNNAGAFSVPEFNKNELNGLSINTVANIVEKSLNNYSFEVPTGNGFCLYIKREAIYAVGFFDEVFGRGYCEENDFCMRLIHKGWKNIIEPSVYIYHAHNVSFSTEKEQLYLQNRVILDKKHPSYDKKVKNFINSIHLSKIHDIVGKRLNSKYTKEFNRKRVLYVIHEGNGGTLHTSIDLMKEIQRDMDTYILTVGEENFSLYTYGEQVNNLSEAKTDDEFMNRLVLVGVWPIKSELNNLFSNEFKTLYFNLLVSLNIDIVHIRHMIMQSLDLPYVAKKLGIPVILSFHDFYYVCPSHNLIDNEGNYCGGHCTAMGELTSNDLNCKVMDNLNLPVTKTFVGQWRKYMHDMFRQCSAFVTTSRSTYDIYTEFYPELKNRQFEIIEHGRNLTTPDDIDKCVTPISEDKPIKIVFPGLIGINKGGNLIRQIKELDKDNKIEIHYMGALDSTLNLEDYGTYHGFYNRSEFCKIIHDIKPHLIGILSIWPETYCHTLTEAWSCGIPVLTIDIGALGERVHDNGGGFFVDNDPKKAYEQIIEISRNPDEYIRVANDIPSIKFKSTEQMGVEYKKLYDDFLNEN